MEVGEDGGRRGREVGEDGGRRGREVGEDGGRRGWRIELHEFPSQFATTNFLAMDNPQECNICFTAFDDSEHRPRTLPCGHTYCSPCIGGLMDDGLLCCPSCRAHHPVTQVSQFPISYTIEAFVKKMKSDGAQQTRSPRKWASLSKSAVAGSSTQRGVKRKLESLLDEEKSSIITMTTLWKDVNSQLDEYDGQLNDWELEHNSLLGQLNKLEKRQFHAMRLLRKEKTKLQNIKKDGNEALKQLENVQKMINTIKKPHEYITAIENADNCSEIVERWYQTCQENFPDVETITFTKKIQEITKAATAALAAAETAYNERVYPTAIPADPSSSIMQRIKMYTTPLKQMTIEELFTMEQPTRRLVEDGKVFGIQKIGDQLRSSRLTLENDKLFLHCLLDKPPPLDTHTIQVANLMQTAIEESTLVFLELCWGGSSRGRVYIRLELDTSLGRQFSQLCTGLHGQSYRNTSFIQVCDKGENGAYMVGGDYEFNNGEGGAPVVTHSNEERYRSSTKAGVLGALWEPRSKRSAQFFITTRGNRRDSEEERRDDGRSNYDHDYDDRERRHERRRRGNDERNKKGRFTVNRIFIKVKIKITLKIKVKITFKIKVKVTIKVKVKIKIKIPNTTIRFSKEEEEDTKD
ncbi:hypothetical protein Pmani_031515 [Petrolisthes manimaculis]|uniref:RING-type domain-containing protein n=2 Tax=Petrolisthes manimaculis TaxID=1843537 RepID=A0AAE1NTI1_9EUCA|nr:hypothetical protein Pmani_031515 [Petrolisthes manimaculis]